MKRIRAAAAVLLWASGAFAQQQVGGGVIVTVAGTGVQGYSGDGDRADRARLSFPVGDPEVENFGHLAVDADGNLYIADQGNHRIRKVDRNGMITTFAGVGESGFSGDAGQATAARINFPAGLAVDSQGNVYFTDQRNNRVRRVDRAGVITTVAGDGSSSTLSGPAALAIDAAGNIYIADYFNDRVRVLSAQTRALTTIAGTGTHADEDPGRDGVAATTVSLGFPSGLAVDGAGNLYISDSHNQCVRVVNLQNGLIRRIAGTAQHAAGVPSGDTGPARQARLDNPVGLALDAAGHLYIADMHNGAIRKVEAPLSANPIITTPVALGLHPDPPATAANGDSGPAWAALLDFPTGLAIDAQQNLYIADWHVQRVRRASPGTTVPRPFIFPGGLVNGASFVPAPARVAPGSIVAIFGRRMAPGLASATGDGALPRALLEPAVSATVTFANTTLAMPLFFVSPDQINAQLPIEVPHSAPATVHVRVGAQQSDPLTINVSLSETGIFFLGANRAIAQNADGRLNSLVEPAVRGSFIVVYISGQGALDPPVPTGERAPLPPPLSRSAYDMHATIGGLSAQVLFLGATPGFVGLSQANIVVPENAPTGDVQLVINVAGHDSNVTRITLR